MRRSLEQKCDSGERRQLHRGEEEEKKDIKVFIFSCLNK